VSAEPCPNCGARVVMIRIGVFKKCPVCGHMWYDAGSGRSVRHPYTGSGGAAAMKWSSVMSYSKKELYSFEES